MTKQSCVVSFKEGQPTARKAAIKYSCNKKGSETTRLNLLCHNSSCCVSHSMSCESEPTKRAKRNKSGTKLPDSVGLVRGIIREGNSCFWVIFFTCILLNLTQILKFQNSLLQSLVHTKTFYDYLVYMNSPLIDSNSQESPVTQFSFFFFAY